jgi:ATP-dependent helicase/DNAse subunit B
LFLKRFEAVLIDGFHRFEPVELELIAALSKVQEVGLWLVGIPDTASWRTVEEATTFLKARGERTTIIDWGFKDSAPATPFAPLGRRLFENALHTKENGEAGSSLTLRAGVSKLPKLYKLEVASPLGEVEAVARQIKADYLEAQMTDLPLRLSDVAVIIPGPAYDPLIREVFPRAGLEFNLAGRALLVSTSRPARVLLAAIKLIQGRWRYELLRDFLNQPLVHQKLDDAHRLDDLFEHRPRARQRMDHEVWSKGWKKQLERLKQNIEGWRTGRLELPVRTTLVHPEDVAKQTVLAGILERLIASSERILGPIDAMEGAFANPSEDKPLRGLIRVVQELLVLLEVDQWLTPKLEASAVLRTAAKPSGMPEGPVLWVEYEKDQNAYLKLLNILESLQDVPASRIPKRSDGRPDVLAALR